jgi:hypothetical protein
MNPPSYLVGAKVFDWLIPHTPHRTSGLWGINMTMNVRNVDLNIRFLLLLPPFLFVTFDCLHSIASTSFIAHLTQVIFEG